MATLCQLISQTYVFTNREPLGVIAAVVPWNSQIFLSAIKIGPALSAGNTIVLKASEHASAPLLEFGKLISKAGIPDGVVNIVTGFANPCGTTSTSHPKVAKIAFTGGPNAARHVVRNSAENFAEVSLELGGKSPFIVFDDANIESAVNGCVAGIFAATGQSHISDYTKHFSVLTYDLCGHGSSELPSNPINLTLLAEQLQSLMVHLDIMKAVLIGFSLGGMINRRFALDYPEKVSALVILNSPHERGEKAQRLVEAQALDSAAGGPEATIEAALQRWFTPKFVINAPATVAWVRKTVLANDRDNYAAHRFVLAAGVTELITPTAAITCPTLIMTCENDTGSTPDMSKKMGLEISAAEILIIAELKHLGLLEQPTIFTNPIIKFLINLHL